MTISRRDTLIGFGLFAASTHCAFADVPTGRTKKNAKDAGLRRVLGDMPKRPTPRYAVLETATLGSGTRYKIEYLSEEAYAPLHEPEDRVRAYLFVPSHALGQSFRLYLLSTRTVRR